MRVLGAAARHGEPPWEGTDQQHEGAMGMQQTNDRPRVAIVGAGFAGLQAAKALADAPVDVTLVDRNNYHKFQPLLYQVATAGLEPDEIVHPVRDVFRTNRNVRFLLGSVRAVDAESRCLRMENGPPIPYDYLILAAGAVTNYFGVEGAAEHGFAMKTVPEALHLRNHVLRQFERYERDPDSAGEGALTFVLVGGGPTGVELAGQFMELFRCVLRADYRRVDTTKARVILLEMLPDLLPAYARPLQDYTRAELEERGVEVRTGTTVERVTPEAAHLKSGEVVPTRTLVWAAGVQANPLAGTVGTEQARGGRLVVEDDLSVPGHPEIFAVGDVSGGQGEEGEMYVQLATVAIQQGRHAGQQVLRRVEGRATERFVFNDPGIMATIGRSAAVAQFPNGLRLKGSVAWLIWAFVHIYQLVGFRNRFDVFLNWVYNYVTYDFNARLIMDVVPAVEETIEQYAGPDGRPVLREEPAPTEEEAQA